MILNIIIFFVAIIAAFGMITFRAWKIKTLRVESPLIVGGDNPKISFRHVEKIVLYLTKHILLWVVVSTAKFWFISTTRTKKWVSDKWPKIHNFFKRKPKDILKNKNSFINRVILESKIKIKRIKEKVKKDHEL